MGGSIMNESITRAAGAVHGQELVPERMEELIREVGRRPQQRSTLYSSALEEQSNKSFHPPELLAVQNGPANVRAVGALHRTA